MNFEQKSFTPFIGSNKSDDTTLKSDWPNTNSKIYSSEEIQELLESEIVKHRECCVYDPIKNTYTNYKNKEFAEIATERIRNEMEARANGTKEYWE